MIDFKSCITVKERVYRHQIVYNGPSDGVHCIFCQNEWANHAEADKQFEAERLWREVSESIRWPE
jgi:hypothetical protein